MNSNSSGKSGRVGWVDYFNTDDILASQEKITCRFELCIKKMGYLDPGCESEDIPAGYKLEVPFWLGRSLYGRRKQTVTIEVPKHYRDGYREIFSADATVVNLHKLSPFFYLFGTHILKFDHAETTLISKSLLQTFQGRFRKIMDSSQNAFNEDTTFLTEKLDETERHVFHCGQQGLQDFQRWETRQAQKLTTSIMVMNHKKRKRAQMEES